MDDIPAPLPAEPQRFMDQLRAFMRVRQLPYRTEKTYQITVYVLVIINYHRFGTSTAWC